MLPTGPRDHPAVQLLRWIRDPLRLMDDVHARYGDVFTMQTPGKRFVVMCHPDAVKEVFALGSKAAHAGKANIVLRPFLGTHSLLLLDGPEHMRQRKMMLPAFHGERMHSYGEAMIRLANDSIDKWPVGERFAVHPRLQSITLEVIIRTVFGIEQGPRFARLTELLARALEIAAQPLLMLPAFQIDLGPWSPWGRFRRLSKLAGDVLRDEIRRGRAQGTEGRADILAMLLEARDERGRPLSEDEVQDELVTLLVAGHETTATAIAWALGWVWREPSRAAQLRDEVAGAEGDPRRIAQLEGLDAVVRESLRLVPVIPMVGRVLQEETRVAGLDLPAGTPVAVSIYLLHRHPELYPDPRTFRPERFSSFKPAPWEWIPFGGGPRRCIGAAFALYEMKMVLACVLTRIDARPASDSMKPVRRAVTLTPAGGLPIVVTARRSRVLARES